MPISLKKCVLGLFLTLIGSLSETSIAATPNVKLTPDCLTREQKENIVIAFEENAACHKKLEEMAKISASTDPAWELVAFYILAGVAGGIVIDNQLLRR